MSKVLLRNYKLTYKKYMDKKIDDVTLEVSKVTPEVVIPEKVEKVQYDINFLLEQKKRIEQDRENTLARNAEELAKRDAELAEVNDLIARAESVGIVTKPVEKPVEPLLEETP
jgi:hypothetical protein